MEKLAKIFDHLRKSESFYLSAAAMVRDERWLEAPARGAWSAGEISAHVVMIEERILGRTAKTLEKPPISQPFWKRFHLPVSLGASRRRRVLSPVPLDPAMVIEKHASLARVSAARIATLAFMESIEGKKLGRIDSRIRFWEVSAYMISFSSLAITKSATRNKFWSR